MQVLVDMMGNKLQLDFPPRRIISLVPSQTELLYDLGLEDEVISITKFCVHPEKWFRSKTRIGGTKQLHIDKIIALQPDLIIANKEENERAQIEELQKHFPVWISDIKTIEDALLMISMVGMIVNKRDAAYRLINEIREAFNELESKNRLRNITSRRAAYFIWYHPWMTVGGETFISDVMTQIGLENIFASESRYPEVSLEALVQHQPELVLLSSEPFPFKEKHVQEIKAVLPDSKVVLVDGEMFSWYGSRMLKAVDYFQGLMKTL